MRSNTPEPVTDFRHWSRVPRPSWPCQTVQLGIRSRVLQVLRTGINTTNLILPALCAMLLLTTSAHAQHLDFGSKDTAPKPGQGLGVLALADLLESEADDLDDDSAQQAFRQLSASLLRAGESAGPAGSEAALASLTLAAHRDELDRLLRARDQTTHRYISQIIDSTGRSILPREVDLVLRDCLAPLTAAHTTTPTALATNTPCGWWLATHANLNTQLHEDCITLRALLGNRRLTDEASDALAAMLTLLESATDEPAYQRDATEWAALLTAAAAALDEPPTWLDMPARDQLRVDVSTGLLMCIEKPADARTILARTSAILRIIAATDALDDPLQSRDLRDAINRLAAAAEGNATRDPAAVAHISETYLRALDLVNADQDLPAPKALVRQIRPMLKPLAESHRHAADAMVRVLPTILSEPDPMTEPGVLAAMHALTQAAADLRIPGHLSTLLTTWTDDPSRPSPNPTREPIATRTMGPLTERIRTLGVELGRKDQSADALEQLRKLASFAHILPYLPSEADLRAGVRSPTWRRVTGDQADRLLFLLNQAREKWLQSQATAQFAERRVEDEVRVRALAEVLPLLRDGAAVEALRLDWARKNEPALNAWPGWELTRPGLDALAAGLTARLAELSALAARNDDHTRVLALAKALRADYAAAFLCVRLNTVAKQTITAPCTIADELGLGPPQTGAWMADHRSTLATICRSAYEAAATRGEQREMFLAHANQLALPILDALP